MDNHKKQFCNTIDELSYRHSRREVFVDFCELSALSLRQPFEHSEALVQRFHETIQPYGEQASEYFGRLLGIVVEALTEQPRDFLGECFHELELHNSFKGQFFTPYPMSRMMCEMALNHSARETIEAHGYLSMNEPACGSGGIVVAAGEILKELGYNPVDRLWVVAQDIDRKCCCMCYIQMSLLAIPGAVIWGDTLMVECREQWLTAGTYLGNWHERFRLQKMADQFRSLISRGAKPAPVINPEPVTISPAQKTQQLEFNF